MFVCFGCVIDSQYSQDQMTLWSFLWGVHITEDLTMSISKNSAYIFSAGWKEQVSLHPSSPPSTGEPLRAYWSAASLSGTGTVVQQTARPSSGQWTQLQKSSVPLSPPSWIFSLHEAPTKPIVSWRTPPILPTVSSSSYHQEDVPEHQSPLHQTAQQLLPPGRESPDSRLVVYRFILFNFIVVCLYSCSTVILWGTTFRTTVFPHM